MKSRSGTSTTTLLHWAILTICFELVSISSSSQFHFQNYNTNDGLAGNEVYCIFQDSRDFIWFGTMRGLSRFDGYEFRNYTKIDGDSTSISDNFVTNITEDSSGYLWIGTSNGLSRYDPVANSFKRYFVTTEENAKPLAVNSVIEDKFTGSTLLLATSQGLIRFNHATGKKKVYSFDARKNSINQTTALSLFQDSTFLWIGLAGYGLDRFDLKANEFTHFQFECDDPTFNFRINVIRKITKDTSGNLLLSTYGGLVRFDPRSGAYAVFHKQNNRFPSNTIWEMAPQNDVDYVVATYDAGILDLNLSTFKATRFESQGSVSKLPVETRCVLIDKQKNIWVGTGGYGVYMASPLLNRMESKTQISIEGPINRIHRASNGDHWIGIDQRGLAQLSSDFSISNTWQSEQLLERTHFTFFSKTEGFRDFYAEATTLLDSQRIAIGGVGSIYVFNPQSAWTNKVIPKVYLTRIAVLNHELGENDPSFQKEITLTYLQNVVSMEFASLNFIVPARNKYAYKLDGFDQSWTVTDAGRRLATYTNLDPGTYTFRVRASWITFRRQSWFRDKRDEHHYRNSVIGKNSRWCNHFNKGS